MNDRMDEQKAREIVVGPIPNTSWGAYQVGNYYGIATGYLQGLEDERAKAKGLDSADVTILLEALERIIDDKPLLSHDDKCNSGCICDEIIAEKALARYKGKE